MRPYATALVVTSALLLLPGPLAAQRPAADTTRARDSVGALPVDPIVVTVSKLPLRRDRSGFAVSVLDVGALEAEHPVYAAEALRELPGSFIDESVGPGGPTIIRLRGGEEVFTQILMDGVQVNENGGFFDFQGVTLSNLERIEVARGPQSALYGSSAVSGVVHFVTRSGEPGPPRFGGTLEGGGDTGEGRSFRGSGEVHGGSESLLYSGSAGVAWNRGIYDLPHDTWTVDGSARLDATPSEDWRLTGIARVISVDSRHPVRDAGVSRVPLDPNAELARDRWIASATARHDPSPRWSHRLRTALFRQDFLFADERDDIAPPEGVTVTDATYTFDTRLWRGTAEYVGGWASADAPEDARVAVAFGGQVERETLRQELLGDFGDSDTRFDRNNVAGFVDVQAAPHPRLDVLVGARLEKYEGVAAEVTPRASATWAVVPDRFSLRAAGGRAYKVPNLMEQFTDNGFLAANPDLEAETSRSWEVGMDLRAGAGLSLSATGFLQSYDNLIRTVPTEEGERFQNRNIGESRARGVEGRLDWRLTDAVSGGLTLTRTWTEVIDNTGLSADHYPEGEPLPFRPDGLASARVRAQIDPRISLLVRATRVGSQVVLSDRFAGERVEVDGYLRLDGTVDLVVDDRTTVYLRMDNLLDAEYETAFDRPGIPPTAVVGVRVR